MSSLLGLQRVSGSANGVPRWNQVCVRRMLAVYIFIASWNSPAPSTGNHARRSVSRAFSPIFPHVGHGAHAGEMRQTKDIFTFGLQVHLRWVTL